MKLLLLTFLILNVNAKEETLRFPFSDSGKFELVNGSGDIGIVKGEGKEIVVAYKMKDRDGNCKVKSEVRAKTFLKIETKGNNCHVIYAVSVPQNVNLDIKAGSGDLSAKDINGDIVFKTGRGNIQVLGDAKSFEGRTGSGDMKFVGVTNSVNFRSGSGDLNFEGFARDFKVKTGSGDMRFLMEKKKMGNISLDASSGSGDVELYMPEGTTFKNVDFKSGWGKVKGEFTKSEQSEIEINVRTGSGNLYFKKI